jgi:MarR family
VTARPGPRTSLDTQRTAISSARVTVGTASADGATTSTTDNPRGRRLGATSSSRRDDYRLLAALEEFGPSSQADLGRRTSIDRSDVVAALNELADRGLVRRAPDPEDRSASHAGGGA